MSSNEARASWLDRRPASLPTRRDSYKEWKRGEAVNHFEVTVAANKSLSSSGCSSNSKLATVYVPQNITRKRPGSYPVSFETRVAALLQASKPCVRLHSCRSSELVRGSSFDASASALDGALQLVFLDPPCHDRRLRKSKNFAHDIWSCRGMKNTVELILDLLWRGGDPVLFSPAHLFAGGHTFSAPTSSRRMTARFRHLLGLRAIPLY